MLLEDLLEQEKREQEKQNQNHPTSSDINARSNESESTLLSDHDFERLKADVFSGGHVPDNASAGKFLRLLIFFDCMQIFISMF